LARVGAFERRATVPLLRGDAGWSRTMEEGAPAGANGSGATGSSARSSAGAAGEASQEVGVSARSSQSHEEVREQDRFLPIANISRIMKKGLPPNAKVSKEARETIQECVSEFIAFVTTEASDKVLNERRKTITGDDVLWAMTALGFDNYIDPLKIYLARYREAQKMKKQGKSGKSGAKASSSSSKDPDDVKD